MCKDLWQRYYQDVQGIIFVVDSAEAIRFVLAKDELQILLEDDNIRDAPVPILFFANKMDMASAATPVEVMEALDLISIKTKPWHITASNALTGTGVDEGLRWLTDKIKEMVALKAKSRKKK